MLTDNKETIMNPKSFFLTKLVASLILIKGTAFLWFFYAKASEKTSDLAILMISGVLIVLGIIWTTKTPTNNNT